MQLALSKEYIWRFGQKWLQTLFILVTRYHSFLRVMCLTTRWLNTFVNTWWWWWCFFCFFVLDDDSSPGKFCNTTLLPGALAWVYVDMLDNDPPLRSHSRKHQHRQCLHWKPRRENRKICLHVPCRQRKFLSHPGFVSLCLSSPFTGSYQILIESLP